MKMYTCNKVDLKKTTCVGEVKMYLETKATTYCLLATVHFMAYKLIHVNEKTGDNGLTDHSCI